MDCVGSLFSILYVLGSSKSLTFGISVITKLPPFASTAISSSDRVRLLKLIAVLVVSTLDVGFLLISNFFNDRAFVVLS